jgi:hypothetical protein
MVNTFHSPNNTGKKEPVKTITFTLMLSYGLHPPGRSAHSTVFQIPEAWGNPHLRIHSNLYIFHLSTFILSVLNFHIQATTHLTELLRN